MIKQFYYWFYHSIKRRKTKNRDAVGYWMESVRETATQLCKDEKGRLLEIGVGAGMFLTCVFNANPSLEFYGIDKSNQIFMTKQTLQSKFHLYSEFIRADGCFLPFKENTFDVVVCINTLFVLGSWDVVKRVIAEISYVCRKQARCIIDFRNSLNPLLFLKYRFAKYYDPSVKTLTFRTYKLRQIHNILNDAGLKIIKEISIGFPMKSIAPIIIVEAVKV